MQIEAPPVERAAPKPEGERRGLILAHTGDGRGKSNAAFGCPIRVHGRGNAVKTCRVMKVPSPRFGKHRLFEQTGISIEGPGDGFSWKSRDFEHPARLARDGWARSAAAIHVGDHFFVVLDELMYPLRYGRLPLEPALQALRKAPQVLLTGRDTPPERLELADTVLE